MSTSSSFPPVYTEPFHQASENLRRALPFINQHQTPVNPVNYAVWYEYVAGTNQALKKRLTVDYNRNRKSQLKSLSSFMKNTS